MSRWVIAAGLKLVVVPVDSTWMRRSLASGSRARASHASRARAGRSRQRQSKWAGSTRRCTRTALVTAPFPIGHVQRAAPVVVPNEGLAAGGGVWSSAVDPGVPLGPGLLATCSVLHGPHLRIATARMNATITANVRECMRLSGVSSSCPGEQRQDAVGDVDSNYLCRTQALGLKRGCRLRCRVNRLPK